MAQFAGRGGSTDALSPLITAMGMQSVGNLLDKQALNVAVEGISDHYYLSALRKILSKDERFRFIPACGVNNVPNLVSMLIGWGCNYKAVFDDDVSSGRKAYNLLKKNFYENDDDFAHKHILKISGALGIEDIFSSADFHNFVLQRPVPAGVVPKNSELTSGKKELLGRLFLEKSETENVTLDNETITKVNEVFDWLSQQFGI